MRLSILVPGIRTKNWHKLYDSVDFQGQWEIIFVGPNAPLFERSNLAYFHSLRSPNACQQLALNFCSGEYVTWAADDGVFLPGALDQAIRLLEISDCMMADVPKDIIVGKYLEGDSPENMNSEDYYRFKYHKTYRLKGVPQDGLIFNCGIISREFLMELGGWDTQNFQATTMAHADLGIRAIKAGANMFLMNDPMFKCSHQPGKTGDHKPVHEAMKKDIKNFERIYAKPNDRITIPLDNWKKTPEVWKERFK